MSYIKKEDIRHIAALARLGLKEEEIDTFTTQIQDTLKYIDILNEVDTKKVEETSQVTGLTNMFRPDLIDNSWFDTNGLLTSTPLPVIDNQIAVTNVFDEE